MKNKRHSYILFILLVSILLYSYTNEKSIENIDHSFEAAKNVEYTIEDFDKVKFETFDDLNLGFFKGNIWIKLSINNSKNESMSYMFLSNDNFNRNYKFYKLDTLDQSLKLVNQINDTIVKDHRTFNAPHANFRIDLAPKEHAIYLITSESDGRSKDANPKIISMRSYYNFVNENTICNIVFYAVIIFLLLINIYLWNIYKQNIYLYYVSYLASTFCIYLGIEGYLSLLKIPQLTIDHIIFIFVKLWALSLIIYTSKFLEIEVIAPKYYRLIKIILATVIGGTLIYQFAFYNSSIQHLHSFENLLTILWVLLIVGIILFSIKKRWLELKYYLIPFAFFILFTVFGIMNAHLQILNFDSFAFVKIGAILEFVSFTYFITVLIKRKLTHSEALTQTLKEKEELLAKKIKPTDLVSVFGLIENSLSTDDEWNEFKLKVKELDPNFVDHLMRDYPNLTKSDLRLLILIRIGYTQKEMAEILNIAPDSVKKARSRIRNKLNLEEKVNLNSFLRSFS